MIRRSRPVLLSAAVYAALMTSWQLVVTPRLPEELQRVGLEAGIETRAPGLARPFNAIGDAETASVLFVGDSRVHQGLVLAELQAAGLDAALLWAGGAQLVDLLALVRHYPARRLVAALAPLGVYLEPDKVVGVRELALTETIDRWTRTRARALHRRLVRMIETDLWARRWFRRPMTRLYDERYRRFLRPETRASRDANLTRIEELLRPLLADGWEVAAVRLPLARGLLAVEEEAFAARRFAELCTQLGIPYLDHSRAPYRTYDGSHLTAREARRYSRDLAQELARTMGWIAPRDARDDD